MKDGAVLANYFRLIEFMVRASLPIHRVFEILQSEPEPKLAAASSKVLRMVERGNNLHEAMASTEAFPPIIISLVRSASDTGRLLGCFGRIAEMLEQQTKLLRKVRAALTYPACLIILTIVVVALLAIFVLPQERALFESSQADIPWPTQIVCFALDTVLSPWLMAVLLVGLNFLLLAWRLGLSTSQSNKLLLIRDEWLLRVPLVGSLLSRVASARMLYVMASLFEVGVPVGDAFDEVATVTGNRELSRRFLAAQEDLKEGATFSEAYEEHQVFPPMALQFFRAGEEEGGMDASCRRAATLMDEQVAIELDTATSLLEPLALCFMGTVIGALVIAMALPTMGAIQLL